MGSSNAKASPPLPPFPPKKSRCSKGLQPASNKIKKKSLSAEKTASMIQSARAHLSCLHHEVGLHQPLRPAHWVHSCSICAPEQTSRPAELQPSDAAGRLSREQLQGSQQGSTRQPHGVTMQEPHQRRSGSHSPI